MTAGHIRRRGERSWELKFDVGADVGGQRQIRYHSFKTPSVRHRLNLHASLRAQIPVPMSIPTRALSLNS
jgi:hypothetical protein